jgi:hypothetical protein
VIRALALLAGLLLACAALAQEPVCAPNCPTPGYNYVVVLGWSSSGRPSSPYPGQLGYNQTTGLFEWWNGAAWVGASTGGGTVTSVTAGAGLSGGTITGIGTIAVIYGTGSNTSLQGSLLNANSGVAPLDANARVPYANLPAAVQERTISLSWVGLPGISQIAQVVMTYPCNIAANLANSQSWANTEATSSAAVAVSYIHSGSSNSVGNVTFTSSGHTGSLPTSSAVDLVAGDVLQGTMPSSPDATLADVQIGIACLTVTP